MVVLRTLHFVCCCTLRPSSMALGYYRYNFRGKCTLIDISILNPSYCTKLVHLKSRMPNFTCFRGIWQFSSLPTVCPHLQRFSLSLLAFYLRWDPGWGECWGPTPNFLDVGQCVFNPCSGARGAPETFLLGPTSSPLGTRTVCLSVRP